MYDAVDEVLSHRSLTDAFEHLKGKGYKVEFDGHAELIDLGTVAGGRCRLRRSYLRISGLWAVAYVEQKDDTGRYYWYLCDHSNQARELRQDKRPMYEVHETDDFAAAVAQMTAAFAHVHRTSTLAWITGKVPLPWISSNMEVAWMNHEPGPGRASSYAYLVAMTCRLQGTMEGLTRRPRDEAR